MAKLNVKKVQIIFLNNKNSFKKLRDHTKRKYHTVNYNQNNTTKLKPNKTIILI
jgi:hypothetical protein